MIVRLYFKYFRTFFRVWVKKVVLKSMFIAFVFPDFDSFKKQQESNSAKPIKPSYDIRVCSRYFAYNFVVQAH